MVTLRQLEYLVAIAEHGHFSRAAAACHVSQPTLSHQLQLLEERLGTPLIERRRNALQLTHAGQEVLKRARQMLALRQEIEQVTAHNEDNPLATSLTLGVIPTMAPYWLPLVLPALQKAYPQLTLKLVEDQTARLLTALDDNTLDLALLALPLPHETLRTMPLGEEPFVVALPAGHALSTQKAIALKDLPADELLLLEEGHCLRDQALAACKLAEGKAGNASVRASSLETLKHLVRQGLGITLLPQQAVDTAASGIVTRPLATPAFRTLGLAWRPTDPRGQAYQTVADTLSAVVAGAQ